MNVTSRLLWRLDTQIAEAASRSDADCLRAERASYLARKGSFEEATSIIKSLQQEYLAHPHPHVVAWVKFAEGILNQHIDMGPVARDNLKRAKALAAASGATRLQALCVSWLAYLDYVKLDQASLFANLAEAINLTKPDNHAAIARSSLVVAQIVHVADDYGAALPWYERCHGAAVADGDDLMISARMHNMVWIQVAHRRYEVMALGKSPVDPREMFLGAFSTANLDQHLGVRSFDSFLPLLRAQISLLGDQIADALLMLNQHVEDSKRQGLSRLECSLISDQAYCHARLGNLQEARELADRASKALGPEVQIDDLAATHTRLAQTYELAGEADKSHEAYDHATKAWEAYESLRTQLREQLKALPLSHLMRSA